MSQFLFVTGMPRSGTTLIEKVISLHPGAYLLSQPLPLLFARLKHEFLIQRQKKKSTYPLNDMVLSNHYSVSEWVDFLSQFRLSLSLLREVAESMISFSGQYTKPVDPFFFISGYHAQTLSEFIPYYSRYLSPKGLKLYGLKETWCEEFVPYLLKHGTKVIMVLRDPRDVITSLNHGRGRNFGGRVKPHLFNIRTWRKSIALALEFQEQDGFMAIRYEDAVRDPDSVFEGVLHFLGLEPFPPGMLAGELRAQDGRLWLSNSSHANYSFISSASVGTYQEKLTLAEQEFIEACCYPELVSLDYESGLSIDQVVPILTSFDDEQPLERLELEDYKWFPQRLQEELRRQKLLNEGSFDPRHFIFERAFARLREALLTQVQARNRV